MVAPREDVRLGAALLVLSAAIFASVGAAIKLVASDVTVEQIVFFRSSLAFIPMLPFLRRAGLRGLVTDCFGKHVVRALAGVAAMYCYFFAIAHLPLAEAVVLSYTAPLFIPFIARAWLDEGVAPGAGFAAALGFGGILLILRPGAGLLSVAAPVGIVGGLFAALAFVGIRSLAETEPTTRTVFYFGVIASAISAVPLPWSWRTPTPRAWALLVLIGVLAGLGQFALTQAYAHAPASRISPFSYTTVIFATLFGWILWSEVPDALSFIGAALVCVAGVLASWRTQPAAIAPEPTEDTPAA